MAAFKGHCTFGFWHKGMEAVLGNDGAKADQARGSLGRITSLDGPARGQGDAPLHPEGRAAERVGRARRPRPARKPAAALPVPADLAAALKKNKAAAATFENFSPSHRKEYVEWITEAKRDETRPKRLATTLEWLAEGKSRNWKYEKC